MSDSPYILASLGMPEVVVIFVIALLLFGGKNMPQLARTLGRVIREFKKASSEVEREIRSVIDDDPPPRKISRESESSPNDNSGEDEPDYYDESIYPELEEADEALNQPPDVSALPPPPDRPSPAPEADNPPPGDNALSGETLSNEPTSDTKSDSAAAGSEAAEKPQG